MGNTYDLSVFLNCPFDEEYGPIFDALVFAIHDCGFIARCAKELDDGSEIRLNKLFDIIEASRLGIHDISRTELDQRHSLPRFNMPLELGIFLSAKRFGPKVQKGKKCLVLDRDRYRYQKFLSDIAGQDIWSHGGTTQQAVAIVRNWLQTSGGQANVIRPSGSNIYARYLRFVADLPLLCSNLRLEEKELIFVDFVTILGSWLNENPW
ncbi:MAG: hypothetical protein GY719_15720 [bacterium]|nr:hypothetical protein [bacterium]